MKGAEFWSGMCVILGGIGLFSGFIDWEPFIASAYAIFALRKDTTP